ncbi:4a-hydroxytetrahydrobiopterin dehydratase [Streptomyces sp. NPDC049906]|uniref:4a-hydroxytetrahydrobiopterin dehydratase n=1 Tax=Streptomyces sp. NPDC049906 TaxID=3155656 RepID=UPI003438E4E3
MPPTAPLTPAELDEALAGLPGWSVRDGELTASYAVERSDLPALYAAVAAVEDRADHHAAVSILYATVGFALSTHDAGGAITAKDTALAARISELADRHGARPNGT